MKASLTVLRWVYEMAQLRWVQKLLTQHARQVLECLLEAQLTVMRWVYKMGKLLDPKSSVEVLECSLEVQLTVMRWVYEMGQLRWV